MIYFSSKRTEEKLLSFIEDLNKKHPSIKFNFKYSKTEIEVLDTKIYKDTNGKLCLTIYHKPTDQKNYLHFKSAHSPSLKKSIPYSQALHISNICAEIKEKMKHLAELNETFLKCHYQQSNRKQQTKKEEKSNRIPLVMTYNQTLPTFRKVLSDSCSLLKINNKPKHAFKEQPIIAYRRNKNFRDMIGDTTIGNNKVVRKQKPILKSGCCKPCFSIIIKLCCKQAVPTTTFKSNIFLKTYQIFHQLHCKSSYIIYSLECLKRQLKYVGKLETGFNVRLNNHRKDDTRMDSIKSFRY